MIQQTTTGYVSKVNEISMLKKCLHSHVDFSIVHNNHKIETT
jgi:hypothetical protein